MFQNLANGGRRNVAVFARDVLPIAFGIFASAVVSVPLSVAAEGWEARLLDGRGKERPSPGHGVPRGVPRGPIVIEGGSGSLVKDPKAAPNSGLTARDVFRGVRLVIGRAGAPGAAVGGMLWLGAEFAPDRKVRYEDQTGVSGYLRLYEGGLVRFDGSREVHHPCIRNVCPEPTRRYFSADATESSQHPGVYLDTNGMVRAVRIDVDGGSRWHIIPAGVELADVLTYLSSEPDLVEPGGSASHVGTDVEPPPTPKLIESRPPPHEMEEKWNEEEQRYELVDRQGRVWAWRKPGGGVWRSIPLSVGFVPEGAVVLNGKVTIPVHGFRGSNGEWYPVTFHDETITIHPASIGDHVPVDIAEEFFRALGHQEEWLTAIGIHHAHEEDWDEHMGDGTSESFALVSSAKRTVLEPVWESANKTWRFGTTLTLNNELVGQLMVEIRDGVMRPSIGMRRGLRDAGGAMRLINGLRELDHPAFETVHTIIDPLEGDNRRVFEKEVRRYLRENRGATRDEAEQHAAHHYRRARLWQILGAEVDRLEPGQVVFRVTAPLGLGHAYDEPGRANAPDDPWSKEPKRPRRVVTHEKLRLRSAGEGRALLKGDKREIRLQPVNAAIARLFIENPGRVLTLTDINRVVPEGEEKLTAESFRAARRGISRVSNGPLFRVVGGGEGFYLPVTNSNGRADSPYYESIGPVTFNRGTGQLFVLGEEVKVNLVEFDFFREALDADGAPVVPDQKSYPHSIHLKLREAIGGFAPDFRLFEPAGAGAYVLADSVRAHAKTTVEAGDARIERVGADYTLHWHEGEVELTPGEGEMLLAAVERRGRVAPAVMLEAAAHGSDADRPAVAKDVAETRVWSTLNRIKRKVRAADLPDFDLVETVFERGFTVAVADPIERAGIRNQSGYRLYQRYGDLELNLVVNHVYLRGERIPMPNGGAAILSALLNTDTPWLSAPKMSEGGVSMTAKAIIGAIDRINANAGYEIIKARRSKGYYVDRAYLGLTD